MELIQTASDDQIALMGCALALLLSGGLMYVSYFVGQASRRTQQKRILVRNQLSISQSTKGESSSSRDKAA